MVNMFAKSLLIIMFLVCVSAINISAQNACSNVVMPAGTLCLTQAAGNTAAENARELAATKEALRVRDAALLEKDKIIADNKAVADKNVADLMAALHKTEVELAAKTGQLIGCEANEVSQRAIITALLPMIRQKTNGIKIF